MISQLSGMDVFPKGPPRRPLSEVTAHHTNTRSSHTPFVKKIAQARIHKTQPAATRSLSRRQLQRLRELNTQIRKFDDREQFDNAVHTFTCLAGVPTLATRTPSLRTSDSTRLEIEIRYPDFGRWKVAHRVPRSRDRRVTPLGVHEIRQLRNALLTDLFLLYDLKIAFSTDVSSLCIAHRQGRSSSRYLPILDTFDRDVCLRQDSGNIDWAGIRDRRIRKAESQFDALEVRARMRLFVSSLSPEVLTHEICLVPRSNLIGPSFSNH